MTIARVLAELKTIDKRIATDTAAVVAVGVYQDRQDKELSTGKSKADFEKDARAKFDAVRDLILRRQALKSALIKSNSATTVTISGKTLTVAEALEQSRAIGLTRALRDRIAATMVSIKNGIAQNDVELDKRIDAMIQQSLGADKKTDKDLYETVAKPFREANCTRILDPLKAECIVDELDGQLKDWETEINFVLAESNAKTVVDVD